jgi:glutaredoxin
MIVKMIREGLGRVIVFFDFLTRPKQVKRSEEDQQKTDEKTKNLSLYQFYACPFCVKVRRAIRRLNVNIVLKDAQNDEQARNEFAEGGGKVKVPCLRIEENGSVRWLYESKVIIDYIEKKVS